MTKALKHNATYADLYSVPDNFVAEIIGGALYASPRPAYPHAFSASALGVHIGEADARVNALRCGKAKLV